jgi:hypothetical protein
MYQRVLSALAFHPNGLSQPSLSVVVQAGAWVSAKSIIATLQKFSRVGWAVNERGIWKITALGIQALEEKFVLHWALYGKPKPVKPKPVVIHQAPRAMQEIHVFPKAALPHFTAGFAWLYQAPVGCGV